MKSYDATKFIKSIQILIESFKNNLLVVYMIKRLLQELISVKTYYIYLAV